MSLQGEYTYVLVECGCGWVHTGSPIQDFTFAGG